MYIPPCTPSPDSEPPDPLRTVRNRPFCTLAFLRLYVFVLNFVCVFCDRYGCRVSTDSVSVHAAPALFVNLRPFGLAFCSIYVIAVLRTFALPPASLCGENGASTLFQSVDFDDFRVWRLLGLDSQLWGVLPESGFPSLGCPFQVTIHSLSDR